MRQLSLFPSELAPRSEPRVAVELDPQAHPPRIHVVPDGASLVLATRLSSLLREPVEVELTDNAWTMVSYRRVQGRLQFRLHHMFARAQETVMRALAGFTGRNRRAHGRAIDEYVRQHRELIRRWPRAAGCTTWRTSSARSTSATSSSRCAPASAGGGALRAAGGDRSR